MNSSWIKLHSGFTEWEWYKDNNTKSLFIHCLLKANWKNGSFQGVEIPRGSFVTSLDHLAKELGLTIQQTRTALEHLILTGEITNKSTNKYRIITIVKYDLYQEVTNNLTNKQQATNKQPNNQVTTIEDIYILLTSYLERIYARTITELEFEKIKLWLETFDYEVIKHAIDISVLNNAKNFNYVEAILKNWKNANFKTLEDVLKEEKRLEETKKQLSSKDEEEKNKPVKELFDYNWLDEEE